MLIMLMILNQSIDDADQDADQGGAGPQHHQPRRNFDPVRGNNHPNFELMQVVPSGNQICN